MASDVVVGASVSTPKFGDGIVRFVGSTSFAAGVWCGIELATPSGKNDGAYISMLSGGLTASGSVQGERYFSCANNHGLFLRPSQVKVIGAAPTVRVVTMLR